MAQHNLTQIDTPSAQSKAERPSRATPAPEIWGGGIRGPCIHCKRGVCAGRHGDARIVGGGMHGCCEIQVLDHPQRDTCSDVDAVIGSGAGGGC